MDDSNEIEHLRKENASLRDENAKLRDEIHELETELSWLSGRAKNRIRRRNDEDDY